MSGLPGLQRPSATWRFSASRNVRLKWRRLSGPTRRMFEYLTFSTGTERRPRGRMRGSSSPRRGWRPARRALTSDLEDVVAGLGARRSVHALAGLAVALADAARFLASRSGSAGSRSGGGDGDDVLALAADQLALGEVLAELLLDHAADDLPEPLHVAIDLAQHRRHRACAPAAGGHHRGSVADEVRVRDFPRRDKIAPGGAEA